MDTATKNEINYLKNRIDDLTERIIQLECPHGHIGIDIKRSPIGPRVSEVCLKCGKIIANWERKAFETRLEILEEAGRRLKLEELRWHNR